MSTEETVGPVEGAGRGESTPLFDALLEQFGLPSIEIHPLDVRGRICPTDDPAVCG